MPGWWSRSLLIVFFFHPVWSSEICWVVQNRGPQNDHKLDILREYVMFWIPFLTTIMAHLKRGLPVTSSPRWWWPLVSRLQSRLLLWPRSRRLRATHHFRCLRCRGLWCLPSTSGWFRQGAQRVPKSWRDLQYVLGQWEGNKTSHLGFSKISKSPEVHWPFIW